MKLSEAIREGAKLRPMARFDFFTFYRFSVREDDVHSCALGAAYEAVAGYRGIHFLSDDCLGLESMQMIDNELFRRWPQLHQPWGLKQEIKPGENLELTLQGIISVMNDDAGFTREEIATWLESVGL